MKIMSEEEFWAYHEKNPGRFPDVPYTLNKSYQSAASRRRRYFQYLERMKESEQRLQEKMNEKPDEQAVSFREQILARDKHTCQLWRLLDVAEKKVLMDNSGGFHRTLDVAHIKSRGTTPELKWDENNVVLLNRYSHSMLDQGRNPINGQRLTPAEKQAWWKRIVDAHPVLGGKQLPSPEPSLGQEN